MIKDSENRIILFDRYIYDLCIKNMLNKNGSSFIHTFFIRCSTKIKKVYNLYDEPKNIFLRKQELNISDIIKYQKKVLTLAKSNNLPICSLSVSNKNPEKLANLIVIQILKESDNELFNIFRASQNSKI